MPLRHRPHRVVYVPLDDRPVNLKMPQLLAQMVEYELLTPPAELLGNFHTPGQPEQIAEWLASHLTEAVDCAIVNLDMLAYGGLIASRKPDTPTEQALQRLNVLSRLRELAPELTLYASSVILGQAPTAVASDTDGRRQLLGTYSELRELVDAEGSQEQREALQELERQLAPTVREQYLAVRARNHQVNRRAIEEVAAGNVDFLVLCQDDAGLHGLHITEQQQLNQRITELGGGERVAVYPGADEVGMTLLARFVHRHMERQPAIRVIYADDSGAANVAEFEDRPFAEVIAAQVAVVGGRMPEGDETAALTVLVNPPAGFSRQQATDPAICEQRLAGLLSAVQQAADISSRRGMAICDAAFPNGADDVFVQAMLEAGLAPSELLSYGAWNTASNSVGSVLAHATLRLTALQDKGAFDLAHLFTSFAPMRYLELLNSLINAQRAHIQFLFGRFVDDWLYQTQVRPVVADQIARAVQSSAFDLHDTYHRAEEMVHDRLTQAATNLWIDRFMDKPCVEIGPEESRSVLMLAEMEEMHLRLPWRRLFEVDLDFKLNMELVAKAE